MQHPDLHKFESVEIGHQVGLLQQIDLKRLLEALGERKFHRGTQLFEAGEAGAVLRETAIDSNQCLSFLSRKASLHSRPTIFGRSFVWLNVARVSKWVKNCS